MPNQTKQTHPVCVAYVIKRHYTTVTTANGLFIRDY